MRNSRLHRLVLLLALAALAYLTWRVVSPPTYRVDVDVYRTAARAWLDGRPLYGGVRFDTQTANGPLPFTYPPLAAIAFAPFAWMTLPAATAALNVTTVVLLVLSMTIVLSGRWSVAAGFVAAALWLEFEPLWATLAYGQINVVLMALVLADCLPGRTRWPRGLLVGLAIAVKLTPAVFLLYLYFPLRRQARATLVAVSTFAAATGAAAVLAPADSREYWTNAVAHPARIGNMTLSTNQNIEGALARLHVPATASSVIWVAASLAVLALSICARRALGASEPVLALMCVALFGLVVSPVSWSHHWVWLLPALLTAGVVGYRRRSAPLLAVGIAGLVLVASTRVLQLFDLRPDLLFVWRGITYVYWALAYFYAAAVSVGRTPSLAVPSLTSAA